ncbi:Gfo/Idh/MocA family protein [Paenibacillus koleovorans]|uniref:Gfo/Idh/MocA family protein n=1 Tax=Paenibacillus koleovorans TaxID=121608 RepID=UPI000FD98D38|nr:Gfo/Idh/MocA family oxidoreductase [Paenibacillus koleovorans]
MSTQQDPVRLAVVGGRRGASFKHALGILADRVQLVAVCELNEGMLRDWQAAYPGIAAYSDYDRLLENPNVDAVLLATPLTLHAGQAVRALRAGKHVLSEVIAAHTLEDAWELVETVEQTGLTYMMAENYCYMRPNMMIGHMVEQGVFGDITFVEGAYLHDCRRLTHDAGGALTWRGNLQRSHDTMNYPTHSLGPLAQWLGINRTDELDYMSTYTSRNGSMAKYFREQFGEQHPGSRDDYWLQGDSAVTTIRTKKGVVISLRLDWVSGRPHQMTHYGLQGTGGAYISSRHHDEDPLVWIEGRSPGSSIDLPGQPRATWESLWGYRDEYEHPLWRSWLKEAEQAGHGGGDFFVIDEFVGAILERRPPAIDVYDAVTWSSVFPLSAQSVAARGKPVDFPAFARNRRTPAR